MTNLSRTIIVAISLCIPVGVLAFQPELISKPEDPFYFGVLASDRSSQCMMSTDGLALAYSSEAQNLISDDVNGEQDIFLLNRNTGQLRRISENALGEGGDDFSQRATFSSNGRYVAFLSRASNLVAGDTNESEDVFRFDRQTGQLERVSLTASGTELADGISTDDPSLTADGQAVSFMTRTSLVAIDTNTSTDAYMRDLQTGAATLLSIGTGNSAADSGTNQVTMSADGLFAALESTATNLVANDTNGQTDIFVRDIQAGITTRVMGIGGAEPNGRSDISGISADGGIVLFTSRADNLVANDNNLVPDVFVYDRVTQSVSRVSVDSMGSEANAASGGARLDSSGRYIVFDTEANNLSADDTDDFNDVYVHDTVSGETRLVSYSALNDHPIAGASDPCIAIAGSGPQIGFISPLSMGLADDINGASDVFIRSIAASTTSRMSEADTGGPYPVYSGSSASLGSSTSSSGDLVAMGTSAQNFDNLPTDFDFTQIALLERRTGLFQLISTNTVGDPAQGTSGSPSINLAGNMIAFESTASDLVVTDINNRQDIFVKTVNGTTLRASQSSSMTGGDGTSSNPEIAGSANVVVFESVGENLVASDSNNESDIFVHDLTSRVTSRVSVSSLDVEASDSSREPAISDDGQFVAFESDATNLVPEGGNSSSQIFRHDRISGETLLVSTDNSGVLGGGSSNEPSISADGRFIAFDSQAENLVGNDNNALSDIFLRDMLNGTTERISLDENGLPFADRDSYDAKISSDGQFVAFYSVKRGSGGNNGNSKGLVIDDEYFVYLRDLGSQETHLVSETHDGSALFDSVSSIDLSGDGKTVTFSTISRLLDVLDVNSHSDVYETNIERVFVDSFE